MCICSPDKDMRQIPGRLFDMSEMMNVEKAEGEKWHLVQTLAGDQTDGYAGVPVLVLNVQSPSLKKRGILGRLLFKRLLRKIFPKMSHLKMQDSQRSLQHLTMTSTSNSQFFGPPPPIIELTMEQDLKMRRLKRLLPDRVRMTSLLSSLHYKNKTLSYPIPSESI